MPEGGPRVVVLDEGDGPGGPHAHDPRRPPLRVHQPPPLVPAHSLLQDSLGREVERCRRAPRLIAPVHSPLPVLVLVVVQDPVRVVARVPELADGELGNAAVDVQPGELAAVALDVVEPPAVKPDGLLQVVEPPHEVLLHELLGVVDVRGGLVVVPGVQVPRPAKLRVVGADGLVVPSQSAAEPVPPALVVLVVGAPVVDHDVRHRLEALGLDGLHELP
mmetsp:Transcript_9929/g.30205  ORF Transcript_9929/g.30205 Transcript_9929/m.30205 type:complete len:219 (+) Transcript_9929:457-1113(+)